MAMSDNKIIALIQGISTQVSTQYESIGVQSQVFVDPNIFRSTLKDGTVIDIPIENFNNYSLQDKAKVVKLITKGDGKAVLFNDGTYKTVNRINNDNIDFPLFVNMWIQDATDTNKYTYTLNHKLNDENISCTIYNSDNKQETLGVQIIDNDNVKFETTTPLSGKIVINFSSSNSDRLSNTATIDARYIFDTMDEANVYFASTKNSLIYGLIISVGIKGSEIIYKWVGENNPTTYNNANFIEQTYFIRGTQGTTGSKPKHKFENNKLYFENTDGTFDEGLTLYGNIDKSNFIEFLKDFEGNNLNDLCLYMDTHKTFLSGLFVGSEKVDGSFKIVTNNSKLEYQRLENGIWKTIGVIGSYTTDVINLDSPYSTINFKTSTRDLNLARITTDGNSIQIGDVRLDRLILSGKEVYSQGIESTNTSHNYIVNNDTSITQPVTNWNFTINIPSQNNYTYYALHAVETNNTTIGYYKYTIIDVLTGNLVYYSGSDFELKQGLTYQFKTTGLHTETLPKLVHLTCGRQYKITFTAQNSIGFKGGLIGGQFKPYCVLKYYFAEEDKLLSKGDMTDSVSSNSSATVASSKAVYTLSQAINSISGGMSPIIPISCEDFSVLTDGTNGTHYILTNDGAILGETTHKLDNIFMVSNFNNRTITTSDYVLIPVNNNSKGNIFITDIEPVNGTKSVIKTMNDYPDSNSILSVMSDDNSYKITVEWDRGEDFCGQPTVNGIDVIGITNKAGGTYTGYVILNSTDINANKIIATLNLNTYTIAFSIISPPNITSITFGSYPNSQTELKEGDSISVTIVTDKPIDTVEFQDIGAFQHQTINATSDTTVTISGVIANRGITLQNLKASIRVKSTEGSWSAITESTDTLPLNNIKPTITLVSKTFSSGFSALKNSETCIVQVFSVGCDTLISSAIGTDLNVEAMVGNNCTVTRLNGDYNDLIANLKIEGTRANNGATNYLDVCVEIANVAPILINTSVTKIRTGETKNINCIFNQKVIINACTIALPNYGTLNTGILPTSAYNTIYNPSISIVNGDVHSDVLRDLTLTIKNMAGLTTTLLNTYKIRGFMRKTITLTYPTLTATVPIIVDMNSLMVSGTINSVPSYNICTQMVATPSVVSDYNITDTTLTISSATYMFNYNNDNNITVLIEEL